MEHIKTFRELFIDLLQFTWLNITGRFVLFFFFNFSGGSRKLYILRLLHIEHKASYRMIRVKRAAKIVAIICKGKGKVHPRTGHEGPEGEQMYSSTLPSTSTLDGVRVSTTPRPLYPRKRPGTHCIGGWMGPRAGLDGCGKSRPHRDSIPGPSNP